MNRLSFVAVPTLLLALTLGLPAVADPAANASQSMSAMHEHQHGADAILDQVANAHTAADHEAIAQWFDAEATRLDEQAERHTKLAAIYRTGGAPKGGSGATMANRQQLAKNYSQTAEEQRGMAAMHRQMAQEAGK